MYIDDRHQARNTAHSRRLLAVLVTAAMLAIGFTSTSARAASLTPADFRIAAASDKFEDTAQFAVAFRFRAPQRLRAERLELAAGTFSTSNENSPFISFGPVWRLPLQHQFIFVELGFAPTLIAGSTSFNGRDLGGHFHFTSSLAIGASFGRLDAASVSLRVQHTSNGGLSSTNPGIDMVGVNFAFDFTTR